MQRGHTRDNAPKPGEDLPPWVRQFFLPVPQRTCYQVRTSPSSIHFATNSLFCMYSMIGYYHAQKATKCGETDPVVIEAHYRQAGVAYLEAARRFSSDDENRVCKFRFFLVILRLKDQLMILFLNGKNV